MNITRRFGFTALWAVAVCGAKEPAQRIYQVGNGVSPPRLVKKVEPQYSGEARKARLEGTVLLRVVIGADGKARDFQVRRSLGLGLDENAIAAVSGWEFSPGVKDGQPVNVQAQIEVNFRLLDKESSVAWHLTRVEFQIPDGAERPVVVKTAVPHSIEYAVSATATVSFDIDEKGEPVNVHVDKSSDDEWARNVTDALANWKFTPGSSHGAPVSVPCTMDFVRGANVP